MFCPFTCRSSYWWDNIVMGGFGPDDWIENFRMSKNTFNYLCDRLKGSIFRQNTRFQKATEQLGVDEVNDTANVIVVPATPTTTLMGLGNYTVYNISVSAVTVGEGPSTSLSQRTAQNGMILLKLDTTAPLVLF